MKIQEDSGSAFILNFHHLLGWKEHPRSWRKLCQLTDETASVERARALACFCARGVCADSVSVLILKAAPLSESRSVTCGYTHLDGAAQTKSGCHLESHAARTELFVSNHICSTILCSRMRNRSLLPTQLSPPPVLLIHAVSMSTDPGLVMLSFTMMTTSLLIPRCFVTQGAGAGTFHIAQINRTHVLFCFLTTAHKSTFAQPRPFIIPAQPRCAADLQKSFCTQTRASRVSPCIVLVKLQPICDLSMTQEVISRDEHNKIPVSVRKICTGLLTPGETTLRQKEYKDFLLSC